MHIHQSVLDAGTGKNIFADRRGRHLMPFSVISPACSAIPRVDQPVRPNVNSTDAWRRTLPPLSISTGASITAPPHSGCPSASPKIHGSRTASRCRRQPYLAFAATLASGYLGMKGKLKPTAPHQGTANEEDVEVARTLEGGLAPPAGFAGGAGSVW